MEWEILIIVKYVYFIRNLIQYFFPWKCHTTTTYLSMERKLDQFHRPTYKRVLYDLKTRWAVVDGVCREVEGQMVL